MENYEYCPLCSKELEITTLNSYSLYYPTNKLSNFIKKSCNNSHSFILFFNKDTAKIDLINFSFNDLKIIVDYISKSTEMIKYKDKNPIKVTFNKAIDLDFSDIPGLYRKIDCYLTFC
jgi:hypothetical protein